MARPVTHIACALLTLGSACGTTAHNGDSRPDYEAGVVTLRRLVAEEDWFGVRTRLKQRRPPRSAEDLYFEARCCSAFNQCRRSSELANAALTLGTLTQEQRTDLGHLLAANAMRLTNWSEGFEATQGLLQTSSSRSTPTELVALRNLDAIFESLQDTPPRSVRIEEDFVLAPDERGRTPLTINGHAEAFAIDTGANVSVIMRSVAEAIGLPIRPARIPIATSIGTTVLANLAVANDVQIGAARFHNVPFLVFPDAMLTFGPDVRIPGLIGFGELESMGEIRFLSGGRLGVYSDPPERPERNLVLDGLDPIIRFQCRGVPSLARLDTGANHTVFYAPFLQEHQSHIESIGTRGLKKTGGVGGVAELEVWRLPSLQIQVAGKTIQIDSASVYQQPMPNVDAGRLHANIGLDVVTRFEEVILNFRTMSFVLIGSS